MSDLVKIAELDWKSGLLFLGALIILFVFIFQKTEWIFQKFGIVTRRQLKQEEQEKTINKLEEFADSDKKALQKLQEHADRSDSNMSDLKTHIQQNDENINKLIECMRDMKGSVDIIASQVGDIQKHNKEMLEYRQEREAKEAAEFHRLLEENKNRDELSLGMARSMLLDNYDKCVAKKFYSHTERDVYHKLYEAYVGAGGNSCIMDLAKEIVKLPFDDCER